MSTADCIAVFDWDKSVDLSAWVDFVNEAFDRARIRPDVVLCGADANGSKDLSFEDLRSAVRTNERACRVIQLFATRPGYKQLTFGWRMCAALSTTKGRTAILSCETGLLDNVELAKQMATIFSPVYGIGFQRPFLKGPDLYAYGMSAGLGYSGADRIEMNQIGVWMRERMGQRRYRDGMLRDVYPLNLLTESHVGQEIENRSLRDWIRQDPQRGQLGELDSQQWIWHVPTGSLEGVRVSLRSAGLVITR